MRLLAAVFSVVAGLCAGDATAQAPPTPITVNDSIAWACPANVTSIAACQALEYRCRVDSAKDFTVLTGVSCVTAIDADKPSLATCTTKVPGVLLPMVNAQGAHTLTISAYDTVAKEETVPSIPFRMENAASCAYTTTLTSSAVTGIYPPGKVIIERNQFSMRNTASRWEEVESQGWVLIGGRPDREQFAETTTAGGGYFYLYLRCRGF